MGMFRAEEEIKRDKERRLVDSFIYKINQLILTDNKYPIIDYIRDYTNRVLDGYDSVFKDITTILEIFNKMIESNIDEIEEFEDHFKLLEKTYPSIVPKNSIDYEKRRNDFINTFIGANGVLAKGIYNEKVAALFENKSLYLDIVSLINNSNFTIKGHYIYIENIDLINKTIINLAPEFSTGERLKNAVIQYLDGFEDIIDEDYRGYSENIIEIAQNRNSIYKTTSKEMAIMEKKLRDVSLVLDRINSAELNLNDKISSFKRSINDSIELIKKAADDNKQLQADKLAIEAERLIKRLDDHLTVLESALNQKWRDAFEEVRKEEIQQLENYKAAFTSYSSLSEDYARMQKNTEEAINLWQKRVEEIKQFSENNPKARRILESQKESSPIERQVIVSGAPTIILPYSDISLPKEISTGILPLLDKSIPYGKRYDLMEELIEKNQKNGVRYHEKFKQAASDLLEGKSLYLYGPSGSGKGYIVEQLASLFSYDKMLELSKITDKFTVEGYRDPQGTYQPSETAIAALYGYLLVQNELDNYDQNNTVMMNSIIDSINKKYNNQKSNVCHVFCNTVAINVHPNFRTVATANTRGEGPNLVYPQREQIDGAVLQRFTPIYIGYSKGLEELAITCENWKQFMKTFRAGCAEYANANMLEEAPGELTTRDIYSLRETIDNNRRKLGWIVEELFTQTKNPDYLRFLGEFVAQQYQISYDSINSPSNYDNVALKDVPSKDIAKTFIYQCKYLRGER